MQTVTLQEHGRVVTDVVSAENAHQLRTKFARQITITPAWERDGSYELTAQRHVGTIVLDGLRIVIRPKLPVENLFFMLSHAYDLPLFRNEQTTLTESDNLYRFVVEVFVQQVAKLARQGVRRDYIEREVSRPYLRGRLLVEKQMRQPVTAQHHFQQRTNDFSADILENQLLKRTLWLLARATSDDEPLRQRIRRALAAFDAVQLRAVTPADCDRVQFTRLNERYHRPIHLAQLLLQNLSIEAEVGTRPFAAFLLPMYQLFELYVARFLSWELASHPTLAVRIQPEIWLDSAENERGIPDIIITRNGEPTLVIDTKYKPFTGRMVESDRYQLYTYCSVMGVERGLLLYAGESAEPHTTQMRDVRLSAVSLALDGSAEQLAQRTRSIISQLE